LNGLGRALEQHGLLIRGVLNVTLDAPHQDIQQVVLVGNAGRSMWSAFSSWWSDNALVEHPLDTWSRQVLSPVADAFHATAVFPFEGPPYLPFQQWAKAGAPVSDSPLKVLLHRDYGPWHAYRGALLFTRPIAEAEPDSVDTSLCVSCMEQPCLSACPVDAFDGEQFLIHTCASELKRQVATGIEPCVAEGCLARRACPVGQAYQYDAAQMRFHQEAFMRSRGSA
tara:strand:+ start:3770 stop:4444 length:675 start_codon:yes stop_codon:yes gene_type:complete